MALAKTGINKRGEQVLKICKKCNGNIKFVRVIDGGKSKKGSMCECGTFLKNGQKVV